MTTLVGGGTLPVGTILAFGGPISALPDGFLACQGALINRNDFAALFAVIGTQWGTSSGTDFRVPTCNGNLIRGRANGSGGDPDRASRTAVQVGGLTGDNVGSLQTWRAQSHRHNLDVWGSHTSSNQAAPVNGGINGNFGNTVGPESNKIAAGAVDTVIRGFNGNTNINDTSPNSGFEYSTAHFRPRTSTIGNLQTVGRNVYVEFIIKY